VTTDEEQVLRGLCIIDKVTTSVSGANGMQRWKVQTTTKAKDISSVGASFLKKRGAR